MSESVLKKPKKTIEDLHNEIEQLYLDDDRPWIIGFSGGKDSTTVLQLVWTVLVKLPKSKRNKQIFVISSDTLVESPPISTLITETHEKINKAAQEQDLPIQAIKLIPRLKDTFWVNLIGKGYPAPSKSFRWCTERLKIRTSDRFILENVSKFGEIILILGVRRAESATRAQSINLYKIEGSILSKHSKFPNSFVYTPLVDLTTDEIWAYLTHNPSPWGGDNQQLSELYDPDFLLDENTPPAGNTRFGCWVCTLVTVDRSLQSLIDSGEEWLIPLRDYRNMLADTQIIEKKLHYREYKRMDGQIKRKKDGSIIPGPYKFEFSKLFLRKLLEIQIELRKIGPDPNIQLILPEELHEIRKIWRLERGDWEDSLPKIYREVTGENLEWIEDDFGSFSKKDEELLEEICVSHNTPVRLVTKLLDIERQFQGMKRRASIYSRIESVFKEEWGTAEEILGESFEEDA